MPILNFGSINIDHVYLLDHMVRPGETLASREVRQFAGGKGFNQSMALARAGAAVFHAGKVGPDGLWLVDHLKECGVDTINNACMTIWGITIGGKDFTKVIRETVAMGMDNDCTAATAGSIVGAVIGQQGIQPHWHKNFNNTFHSYLIGKPRFTISGLVRRFSRQAAFVHEG